MTVNNRHPQKNLANFLNHIAVQSCNVTADWSLVHRKFQIRGLADRLTIDEHDNERHVFLLTPCMNSRILSGSPTYPRKIGVDRIPNTHESWWTSSPSQFGQTTPSESICTSVSSVHNDN